MSSQENSPRVQGQSPVTSTPVLALLLKNSAEEKERKKKKKFRLKNINKKQNQLNYVERFTEIKQRKSLYPCCSVSAQADHEVDKESNPPVQHMLVHQLHLIR